jgi:hypothetical protein
VQWAGEDVPARSSSKVFADPPGLALAAFGQRDISQAGTQARFRPSRFAMADHVKLRERGTHFPLSFAV